MGKRHSAFSGLSRFALEAFGGSQGEHVQTTKTTGEQTTASTSTEKTNARSASQLESEPASSRGEPVHKKRKIGLLGPGYEKYDATGLVPYYTDASEVPEHLKKCTSQSLKSSNII